MNTEQVAKELMDQFCQELHSIEPTTGADVLEEWNKVKQVVEAALHKDNQSEFRMHQVKDAFIYCAGFAFHTAILADKAILKQEEQKGG